MNIPPRIDGMSDAEYIQVLQATLQMTLELVLSTQACLDQTKEAFLNGQELLGMVMLKQPDRTIQLTIADMTDFTPDLVLQSRMEDDTYILSLVSEAQNAKH